MPCNITFWLQQSHKLDPYASMHIVCVHEQDTVGYSIIYNNNEYLYSTPSAVTLNKLYIINERREMLEF